MITGISVSATVCGNMWTCSYCSKKYDKAPGWRRNRTEPYNKCSKCGFTLGRSRATVIKLEILTNIVKANNYDLFIDACAGSGKVQLYDGKIIDGSLLLMEEIAKQKNHPSHVIAIECEKKTFELLEKFTSGSNTQLIFGDCNDHLLKLANGTLRTLVFIDPFGWGVPAIDRKKLIKLSQTPNTDLLFNFAYRISRNMGYVKKNLDSKKQSNKLTSHTWKKHLDTFWGTSEWMRWPSMKAEEWVEKYASPFRENNKVKIFRVPPRGRLTYHLIFATKFDIPPYGLEKFFKKQTT